MKGKESTRSGGCGGGLGDRAEPHREAWNSWKVRGGVRARLRSTGSGKEPAQPEEDPGTLRDARVAPDWLGERGAGARETRTRPLPSARQKQSPAEPGASDRLSGSRTRSSEGTREELSWGITPHNPWELPADP